MKKIRIIPFLVIFGLFFITIAPIKGVTRPAYALSETDSFIVDNDYELVDEESYTVGTISSYISVWIKPSACYPVDSGTPLCTGAFAAEYCEDSEKDQYDEDFYSILRMGLAYPGFSEITEEVPGAGIAFLYTPAPGLYAAIAYFGEQTGIFVIVAEATVAEPSIADTSSPAINAYYDENGMKEVVVAIGEKVADDLNLPGYGIFITIGALTTLIAMVSIIKKRKS